MLYCIYDGKNLVYMDFEDHGENEREEVYNHLKNVWEQQLPNTEFSIDDGMSDEF
jgi:hypothetical protein